MKHSPGYIWLMRFEAREKRGGRMAKQCAYCRDYLSKLDYQLYECWNEECLMIRDKGFPIEWFEEVVPQKPEVKQ